MSKSKGKKYYKNTARKASVNKPTGIATSPAVTTPAPARPAAPVAKNAPAMPITASLGTELKIIGVLTFCILTAIIVLSIVLR